MNGTRTLAAIVFTDAVGFSTRAEQNEEAALDALSADFDVMKEVCALQSGRVLKSMGDGLLMAFDSASQAADAAIEIQRRFAHRPSGALQHRMGVHLCDVFLEANDAHGEGVNLAARLEAEASPGGICMSQTIYDIVKNRLPVQAKSLGEKRLKNLVEPVKVFEIVPLNASRGERIPTPAAPPPSPQLKIPTIPLVSLTCSIFAVAAVLLFNGMRSQSAQGGGPVPTSGTLGSLGGVRSLTIAGDADYLAAREKATITMDFAGMAAWLESEARLRSVEGYDQALQRWRDLGGLSKAVQKALKGKHQGKPFKGSGLGPGGVTMVAWPTTRGEVVMDIDGEVRKVHFSQLLPIELRMLAEMAALEPGSDPRLEQYIRSFDAEFGPGRRPGGRPGMGGPGQGGGDFGGGPPEGGPGGPPDGRFGGGGGFGGPPPR